MGYYTTYTIKLVSGDENDFDSLLKDIRTKSSVDFTEYEVQEAKWSDHDKDMLELSRKYPDLIVQLDGDGQDSEDLWATRYRNGESESVGAVLPFFQRIASQEERAAYVSNTYRVARNNFMRIIETMVRENGGDVKTRFILEENPVAASWCNRIFFREEELWYSHSLERPDTDQKLEGDSPARLDWTLQMLFSIAQKLLNGTYI